VADPTIAKMAPWWATRLRLRDVAAGDPRGS
jgi:hypothetical protein